MSTALDTRCLESQPDLWDLDESVLLTRVLSGDPRAWRRFFLKYEKLILACVSRTAKRQGVALQHHDTWDIFGDVCLTMVRNDFRKLRMYRAERGCSISSWIGIITTSTTLDALRRDRRRRAHVMTTDKLDRLAEPTDDGPDARLLRQERRNILRDTITKFSERDRDFVRLYFEEDQTPEAVASAMGISVNTVYSKKAKIKVRLLRLVHTD